MEAGWEVVYFKHFSITAYISTLYYVVYMVSLYDLKLHGLTAFI